MFEARFLPRYCPRMNVVEYFNNSFKSHLKDNAILSSKRLIEKANEIVDKYNTISDEIKSEIKRYYLHDDCLYAKQIYDKCRRGSNLNKAS